MEPRLILFDIDGTLIESGGAGRLALERACAAVFGIDSVSADAAGVRFAGMTDPIILESLARALGIAPDAFEARRDETVRVFVHELRVELSRPGPRRRALPGVRALLETLAARDDAYLGLATGNIEEGAWAKLEALELAGFFSEGGFASDHPQRRELARLGWRKLCRKFGIEFPRERVVIVGDTEHDVDCARANGFRSVAVDSGWVPRASLEEARPDVLLDDFTDLDLTLEAIGLPPR